jgi:sodium/hydrogen exchanger 8
MMRFSDITFFYFCLPPIVFASGFNMQKGAFFANFKNILLFGVLGTFIAFGSFTGMTIGMKEAF